MNLECIFESIFYDEEGVVVDIVDVVDVVDAGSDHVVVCCNGSSIADGNSEVSESESESEI